MITGFNTDVEHDGVVYHVQTEDKGLESPVILSLVYVGGAILASKRSPYQDLVASGFSDEVLSERLKRQHRLICAAIHSGRLNELKKMSGQGKQTPPLADQPGVQERLANAGATESAPKIKASEVVAPIAAESAETRAVVTDVSTEPRADSQQPEVSQKPKTGEGLVVVLLNEQEFSSGGAPTLRVLVTNRSGDEEKPLGNVEVSVKILGTTFRPLIFPLKTQRDGTAEVSTEIPHFTSGRAAVLIRVVAAGKVAELRRVIHPGK